MEGAYGLTPLNVAGSLMIAGYFSLIFFLPPVVLTMALRWAPRLRRSLLAGLVVSAGAFLAWVWLGRPDTTVALLISLWIAVLLLGALCSSSAADIRIWIVLVIAGLAGGAASEFWITLDETAFRSEVASLNLSEHHERRRAWPNDYTQLFYIPGFGFGATD
jgi:hypothetical protein